MTCLLGLRLQVKLLLFLYDLLTDPLRFIYFILWVVIQYCAILILFIGSSFKLPSMSLDIISCGFEHLLAFRQHTISRLFFIFSAPALEPAPSARTQPGSFYQRIVFKNQNWCQIFFQLQIGLSY